MIMEKEKAAVYFNKPQIQKAEENFKKYIDRIKKYVVAVEQYLNKYVGLEVPTNEFYVFLNVNPSKKLCLVPINIGMYVGAIKPAHQPLYEISFDIDDFYFSKHRFNNKP